ncbi:hypothetical protein PVL29_012073 [Vitis rotundifolia]|uniref:F-box/kelch-repeat protein n=1 Tax=Vitis rotundifolia TaxID=103349 RepID=A0AA39DT31_VITRO|nr:hypothetical protein PVL29_012073 [Vitis rotundifolia]
MARERDECKEFFHRGKYHVIGGNCIEMQGYTCLRTCVDGGDMGIYMCHAGEVVALQESRWQTVDKFPAKIHHTAYMTTWEGKFAYMWDLKSGRWRKVVASEEFCWYYGQRTWQWHVKLKEVCSALVYGPKHVALLN